MLSATVALPVNATGSNTANGALIDLGSTTLDGTHEVISAYISIPATTNTVNTNTQSVYIVDSADNNGVNTTIIPGLAPLIITGGVGNGAAAATRHYSLPAGTRRYVGLRSTGDANSGNNTTINATLQILT